MDLALIPPYVKRYRPLAMRVLLEGEERFLEHECARVRLNQADWRHLLKRTPLGRKVYFQNKGKTLNQIGGEDPEVETLMAWARLPVREWSFSCLP